MKDIIGRAVIFDLDGTLLDTASELAGCANAALKIFSLAPYAVQDYYYLMGDGARMLCRRALTGRGADPSLEDAFYRYYVANIAAADGSQTAPFEGVPALLEALQEDGFSLCVLTNKPHEAAVKLISCFFPERFSFVQGVEEGMAPKPDPAAGLRLLEKLKLDASRCLYVGDSGTDMKTAAALSIPSIGALWGYRSKEELLESGAAYVAEHPLDILRIARRTRE